jgi:hypothetical protein
LERELRILLREIKKFCWGLWIFWLYLWLWGFCLFFIWFGVLDSFFVFSLRVLIIIYSGCNYISSSDEPFITLFRAGKGPSGLHLEVIFSVLPFLWWKEFFQDKIKFFYFRALSSSGIWLKSSFKMGAVLGELVMD